MPIWYIYGWFNNSIDASSAFWLLESQVDWMTESRTSLELTLDPLENCRMWRVSSLPRPWWTCPLQILWNGISNTVQNSHRRQLEWHNERHSQGRMRRWRWLSSQLLCFTLLCTPILCCLRPHGPIRFGQCGGGRSDETPRGVPQTGKIRLLKTS